MFGVDGVWPFLRREGPRSLSRLAQEVAWRMYMRPEIRAMVRPFWPVRAPKKWIFLVGCYNSGTTITRDLLALHPEVRTLPKEGVRFTSELTRPEDLGWNRMWCACADHVAYPPVAEPARVRRIMADWSPWIDPERALLEKSIANGARIPWLARNFPGAYFLGIVRNGYSVAEGIRRRARPRGTARDELGSDRYPIELAGRQWMESNRRFLDDGAAVERFMFFSYEELTEEPASVLPHIWEFLDLTAVPMDETTEGVVIDGKHAPLMNMNRRSIARLDTEDLHRLNPVIGDCMRNFGYAVLSSPVADTPSG